MKYLLFACSMILLDVIGCRSNPQDYLEVRPEYVLLGDRYNSYKIDVTSNVHWSTYVENESYPYESWLDVSPSSGNGNAVITVTAQPNESTYKRSCVLHVIGEGINLQVRVYQAGKPTVDDKDDGA